MTDRLTVVRESTGKSDVLEAPKIVAMVNESDGGLSVKCFKNFPGNTKEMHVFKQVEYRSSEWKKFDLETVDG